MLKPKVSIMMTDVEMQVLEIPQELAHNVASHASYLCCSLNHYLNQYAALINMAISVRQRNVRLYAL